MVNTKKKYEVVHFLTDHMYDVLFGDNWPDNATDEECAAADILDEELTQPALKVLCKIFGHEVMRDMCGKPEHDLCTCCMEIRPGEAKINQ